MVAAWATAQTDERGRPNRFRLSAGIFKPGIETTLQLDHPNELLSTTISAEDDLGLKRKLDAYRIEAWFRMTRRLALTGSWYKLDRDASVYLSRNISFLDTTYEVGAQVNTRLNNTFTSVSLQYSILSKEKVEAGLALGVRYATIDAKADASSDGLTITESYDGAAPAPLPGIFISTHLHPSIMLNYNLEYFKLAMKGVSGGITEHKVTLGFYPLRNVGAGLNWSSINYNVEGIPFRDDFTGSMDYKINGFTFFVSARF